MPEAFQPVTALLLVFIFPATYAYRRGSEQAKA